MASISPICAHGAPNPAYTPEYESVVIPGLEKPYSNCGDVYKILSCKSCEYKSPVRRTCHRAVCSECWSSWATREAENAQERLIGYKQAYKEKRNKKLGNPKNYILSPDPKMALAMVSESGGINNLKKKAISVLRKNGLYGGCIIYHHYRVLNEYKQALRQFGDVKIWDLIRSDALNLGTWRAYVYVSPHFHVKVYGVKINGKAFYKKTSWVLKFKRHISSKAELQKVLFYELSHVALREGKRSLTWFGTLSYNKLSKRKASVEYEPKKCPLCGADLEEEDLTNGRIEDVIVRVIRYRYRITDYSDLRVQSML